MDHVEGRFEQRVSADVVTSQLDVAAEFTTGSPPRCSHVEDGLTKRGDRDRVDARRVG